MKKVLGIIGVFVTIVCVGMGCGKEEINSALDQESLSDTLSIQVGETLTPLEGYKLTFDSLVSDSRCPINAICVWQGMVAVELTAESQAGKRTFVLSTDPAVENSETTIALGYKITLISVLPFPGTADDVKPSDYVVKVAVSSALD